MANNHTYIYDAAIAQLHVISLLRLYFIKYFHIYYNNIFNFLTLNVMIIKLFQQKKKPTTIYKQLLS